MTQQGEFTKQRPPNPVARPEWVGQQLFKVLRSATLKQKSGLQAQVSEDMCMYVHMDKSSMSSLAVEHKWYYIHAIKPCKYSPYIRLKLIDNHNNR